MGEPDARNLRSFGVAERGGTGPLPHPATHVSILEWVAGWGCGPVPDFGMRRMAHSQTISQPKRAMAKAGGTACRPSSASAVIRPAMGPSV